MLAAELNRVSVTYKGRPMDIEALRDLSFEVGNGEFWAVIGPSGCGKSTLLYVLAGLVRPTSGQLTVYGKPLNGQRLRTSLILQDYGLFPWKTVYDNAALGLKIRRSGADRINSEVGAILKKLNIWDFRDYYPAQLSGGMRQRVAIARSLTLSPDLLLMDEPFSSLDALTREELQNALLDIWRTDGLTAMLVTHNIEEAVFLGQKILVLSERPGQVVEVVENPGAGRPDYRNNRDFHTKCSKLRALLRGISCATGDKAIVASGR